MAGRAVHIEPILAAQQHGAIHRERNPIDEVLAQFTGIENFVGAQQASGYRTLWKGTCRAAVSEEIVRPKRNIFRLILHILATPDGRTSSDQQQTLPSERPNAQLRTPPAPRACSEIPRSHGDRIAGRWLRCKE